LARSGDAVRATLALVGRRAYLKSSLGVTANRGEGI
jgi:hypothetical protein